jgi:flagellar motor switch protein FliN
LGSILFNEALDRKVEATEEKFRAIFEQSLGTFIERAVTVTSQGPSEFDFKELKAQLPGEVVFVTLTASEGGPGRMLFAVSKEAAAALGDLLLMGDGKAAFSYEEHLEPVRDLFKEVVAAYCGDLSTELGRRIAFEEVKVALVDFQAADFVGTGWMLHRIEVDLPPAHTVYRLVSMDFLATCFPDAEGGHVESNDTGPVEEHEVAEAQKEMGLVLDIELPISIELGRTSMLIRDIVRLAPGSIVELDKLSGEPVDLLVNGKMFAKGEVVVVDENFAVRVTELVTPGDPHRTRIN